MILAIVLLVISLLLHYNSAICYWIYFVSCALTIAVGGALIVGSIFGGNRRVDCFGALCFLIALFCFRPEPVSRAFESLGFSAKLWIEQDYDQKCVMVNYKDLNKNVQNLGLCDFIERPGDTYYEKIIIDTSHEIIKAVSMRSSAWKAAAKNLGSDISGIYSKFPPQHITGNYFSVPGDQGFGGG